MSGRALLDIVQMSIAVPRGEAGFWSIIRELDKEGPWTVRAVSDRTNTARQLVYRYIRKLRLGGFAAEVDMRENSSGGLPGARVYRLVKKPALAPRLAKDGRELPEGGREQLWRAMRMTKLFSVSDLIGLCPEIPQATTRNYIYALVSAGVLSQNGRVFRLARNLGNQAPRILVTKLVFDPNSKAVIGKSVTRIRGAKP